MEDRFESYLRHAAQLVRAGDFLRAEGLERLARETLEKLGSPPRLLARLHGQRGERAMSQGDYPAAEQAFGEAIAALRSDGVSGGRELFDLHQRLGLARSGQGRDEQALAAFDEAIALAAVFGNAFIPVAYTQIARAESLRRLGRRADAEASLRAAIGVAERAPVEGREKIVAAARAALEELRPVPARARGAAVAQRSSERPAPPPDPATLRFDERAFDAVLAELDGLVGLASVKAQVRRLAELLRIASMRRAAGLKTVQVSLHLIFEGGAGTGKTTVARLFGRLYKSLGLLATDHVVEVTREDLVSGYVGQTATKTSEVIDRALDGVLFLDEAYALVRPGSQGDFGPEALVELLKRMEDDRSRLAVIAAGYPHEMSEFLASNSGFRSRFGETIHFDDYGPVELVQIFEVFAKGADYALNADAREELQRTMERLHAARDRYFGNARTVRNLFDDVVAHHHDVAEVGAGLKGVLAVTELLERQPDGPDNAAYIRTVADCGRTLLRLLDDAAELSRTQEGAVTLAPEPVDLRDLLDSVQMDWALRAAEDGVGLGAVFTG
ncbi:MAG: AAA family ATPase, partial [Actinobacteria bacterium]|nr:AAA family ATPase [Actinomycetota bacterium]